MIVMLERNAVLPTIAQNYGLCQMVFLAKHCQFTDHHTKPLTDMLSPRLWENTQTKTLYMWQTCSTLGHLVTSHWQDKTNRSSQKKHMQKSKIYHIPDSIFTLTFHGCILSNKEEPNIFSSGFYATNKIGSCWILWTGTAIDHLFPMFIAVFLWNG